jgi:hypothetical protein
MVIPSSSRAWNRRVIAASESGWGWSASTRPGAFAHRVEDRAHFVGAKQKLGPLAQKLVEVGGDDRAGVDGQEALGNRLVAQGGLDPQRRAAEAGVAGLLANQRMVGRASPASIASTRSARTIAPPKGTPPSRMR